MTQNRYLENKTRPELLRGKGALGTWEEEVLAWNRMIYTKSFSGVTFLDAPSSLEKLEGERVHNLASGSVLGTSRCSWEKCLSEIQPATQWAWSYCATAQLPLVPCALWQSQNMTSHSAQQGHCYSGGKGGGLWVCVIPLVNKIVKIWVFRNNTIMLYTIWCAFSCGMYFFLKKRLKYLRSINSYGQRTKNTTKM